MVGTNYASSNQSMVKKYLPGERNWNLVLSDKNVLAKFTTFWIVHVCNFWASSVFYYYINILVIVTYLHFLSNRGKLSTADLWSKVGGMWYDYGQNKTAWPLGSLWGNETCLVSNNVCMFFISFIYQYETYWFWNDDKFDFMLRVLKQCISNK